MPDRRLPRYGFFARTVTLKRFTPEGEHNLPLTVECMMVLINQDGMTIAIPPGTAEHDVGIPPFKIDEEIEVSLNPLLIHPPKFNVAQWILQGVKVKWVESIKNADGQFRGFLIGMAFNQQNLSQTVKDWIDYISAVEKLPHHKVVSIDEREQPSVFWENICIGLNAIGVACGIAALLFFRQPVALRNLLLWIMIATTVLYGSYKLFGGLVVRPFDRLGKGRKKPPS